MEHGKDFVYLEEHEEDLQSLQLMYENLEEDYHFHVSALIGLVVYFASDKWYFAFPLAIAVYIVLRKFHSKKVFDKDIRHDRKV